jgi:hypothetical protein
VKRTAIVVVFIWSAIEVGCNSHTVPQSKAPRGRAAGAQVSASAPEVVITKLETSEDRATYLGELANDSSFEPQKHVEMLKKYSNDANEEVAGKAKDLLARAADSSSN